MSKHIPKGQNFAPETTLAEGVIVTTPYMPDIDQFQMTQEVTQSPARVIPPETTPKPRKKR